MSRSYFVTGTDTGVGKTFVSTHLARRARAHGQSVFAFKPIETGCVAPVGDDQRRLVEAAGGWQVGPLAGLYQFALPAAPSVAALAEQAIIDLALIHLTFVAGSRQSDLSIVEGAGGWRVPITDDVDMAGLARRLDLPVILVARGTLGTINHTLLTAEAIVRDGCELAAIVLSLLPDTDQTLLASNVAEISRRAIMPIVLSDDPSVLDALLDASHGTSDLGAVDVPRETSASDDEDSLLG